MLFLRYCLSEDEFVIEDTRDNSTKTLSLGEIRDNRLSIYGFEENHSGHVSYRSLFDIYSRYVMRQRLVQDNTFELKFVRSKITGREFILLEHVRTDAEFISIPEFVEIVGKGAFQDCKNLARVHLSSYTYRIGDSCFRGCEKLEEVDIPDGVIRLNDKTFYNCVSLRRVGLPKGLRFIGKSCFQYATELTSIDLPDSVVSICDDAFADTSLTGISLPKGLEVLGKHAFSDTRLARVEIPDSTVLIDFCGFDECKTLKEIVVSEYSKAYSRVALLGRLNGIRVIKRR